eukprot:gene30614-34754_t
MEEDYEPVDESKIFETGQIVQIHMENFMCHRKFTMDFGRHLNFINGSNGSVCLGARASATGRGSQITKYVREGCEKHEYALIQVTLRNEGTDAYMPELEKKELQQILTSFNIQVDNPCCVLTQEESKKFIQGSDKDKFAFFMK